MDDERRVDSSPACHPNLACDGCCWSERCRWVWRRTAEETWTSCSYPSRQLRMHGPPDQGSWEMSQLQGTSREHQGYREFEAELRSAWDAYWIVPQELIPPRRAVFDHRPNGGARPGEHAHGHLELGISKEAMPKLKKSKQVGKRPPPGDPRGSRNEPLVRSPRQLERRTRRRAGRTADPQKGGSWQRRARRAVWQPTPLKRQRRSRETHPPLSLSRGAHAGTGD